MKPRAAVAWSGGKDSCSALHRAHASYDVVALATMFNETGDRSRSHGLRPEILAAQADRLGLACRSARCTWETYETAFRGLLASLVGEGVTHVIFGDIFFEHHKGWTERVCALEGVTAVQPLWGEPTERLFCEFVGSGGEARIVTVRAERLDASWLGRRLSRELLDELRSLGVDACGENGEYHTVVTGSPLFRSPLKLRAGEQVLRSGCWALDLILGDEC
jgi:diphthine-ammonia ligase